MKLITDKYKCLMPKSIYLKDEVIIAQAWKKTHKYIREHNWYSDTLALDISALGLEKNASKWASSLTSNLFDENSELFPIELVPAPKSEIWNIDELWEPKVSNELRLGSPPIRPLAHITVRDQTFSTALMMCVADAVESAQGNCSEQNYYTAQKNGVFSYGNRLLCDWKDKKAWFRWGNSEIYRKFYTDYQNFLKRPLVIGKEISKNQSDSDHVFIVKLDISKFYDCIDRKALLNTISNISEKFYGYKDDTFWGIAKTITDWKWDDESFKTAEHIGIEIKNNGLPQGLVAAGFFANAYLINFDEKVGSYIGRSLPNSNTLVHDYCMYVDDIRLVISTEDDDIEQAKSIISKWIDDQLIKYAHANLKINSNKTKITSLSDLDNTSSLAGRVSELQSELSGPMDRDTLDGAMGILEGLLDIQLDDFVPSIESEPLLKLARFDNDIRNDTLKRFAANRLEIVMKNKRKLSLNENNLSDNESELLARKLIRTWMQDPSLAVVLRKAFEIFPSQNIAEPVFDAIYSRIKKDKNHSINSAMMSYLLADLFRCCIDFNGYFQKQIYPKTADPEGFLDLGATFAHKIINDSTSPKFLRRQASLLLAALNKPAYLNNNEELIQDSLHAILIGRTPRDTFQVYALYEVAAQITDKPDSIASLLISHIDGFEDEKRYSILEDFAKRDGNGFWLSIWKQLKKLNKKKDLQHFQWAAPLIVTDPRPSKQKLSKIIISDKNGFEHESGLIKLGLGLIKYYQGCQNFQPLSPNELNVKFENKNISWDQIWKPEVTEIIVNSSISGYKDPRFVIPEWINTNEITSYDNSVIYWIGAILRAAAVGGGDFTGNKWKSNLKIKGYNGLKTGWFKRRMGMMYSSEALVGEYATLSNWTSELLMKCLQWPGFQSSFLSIHEINNIEDIKSLEKLLNERLTYLNSNYCEASKMPTLFRSVNRYESRNRGFRLVTVQQLLPHTKDFTLADPKLNLPATRVKNRDHLTRICNLT